MKGFLIIWVDIADEWKINLTVKSLKTGELINVIIKNRFLKKADEYKIKKKRVRFENLMQSNNGIYKAKSFCKFPREEDKKGQ